MCHSERGEESKLKQSRPLTSFASLVQAVTVEGMSCREELEEF